MTPHVFGGPNGATADAAPEPLFWLIWMQATNWGRMVRLPKDVQQRTDWVVNRLRGLSSRLNARYRFRRAQSVGRAYVYGSLQLSNLGGHVSVGNMAQFLGGPIRSQIFCAQGAVLTIADGTRFNYGFRIEVNHEVHIGERCEVASLCRIVDETSTTSGAVFIEDDVWLAHGVTVLPGVRIGKGSVVSAGTVVEFDIPARSLVIGSPARCVALSNLAH